MADGRACSDTWCSVTSNEYGQIAVVETTETCGQDNEGVAGLPKTGKADELGDELSVPLSAVGLWEWSRNLREYQRANSFLRT